MVITASYTDGGAEGAVPLTGSKSIALSSNTIGFSESTKTKDMMAVVFAKGWFELDDIDLTGVNAVILAAGWQEAPKVPYNFDIRLNSAEGEVIGKGTLGVQPPGTPGGAIVMPLTKKPSGKHKLVITGAVEEGKTPSMVALMNATFN